MEETGARDGFAKRQAAGGEDDDGPEEVVEVFFCQDAGAEEEDDRDDGDDAHVAEDGFELVGDAPEDDCHYRHDTNEPLDPREFVFHRAYGNNGGAPAGFESYEQQKPD